MPKVLTQQQINQYHKQGFISPIDVLSEDEALSYKERLEAAEREYPDDFNLENRNNAHLSLTCLDELVHHPVIVDAVEDLIGPDISLCASVLFIKELESAGFVSWHQDATYMGFIPHDFVTPWLALTPSNRVNGCMSMIPGSHIDHIRKHSDTFDEDNILTRGQVVYDVDESTSVDLILRAGQMSLHHAEVIHGSQPNLSDERRIGFAIQSYMPPNVRQTAGKDYRLHIRGNNYFENNIELRRPQFDMEKRSVADRKAVNANMADILYRGAKKKRAY
jgi:hypothetical protein